MSSLLDTFCAEEALSSLHGFQRDAVEYAFHRLYVAPDSTRRFLIADEVGLGKTLIAKGVMAKTLEHLRSTVDRIDVVYICSNLRIARQNINRLNPLTDLSFADAERITLLPTHLDRIAENRINFVAFTPGTSLDLKGSMGTQHERVLLYALLERHWQMRSVSLLNVLQGGVQDAEGFRMRAREFLRHGKISGELEQRFREAMDSDPSLRAELDQLCGLFGRQRQHVPEDDRRVRNAFVGKLRNLLAATCIRALEPDLVILDEFQRFKSLLSSDSDEGELAQQLFAWQSEQQAARVLLLSATPYKAYTLQHELDEEDHYKDFIRTVSFLDNEPGKTRQLKNAIDSYRKRILSLRSGGTEAAVRCKEEIESHLRRVMSRTERISVAGDANGMVRVSLPADVSVQAEDLRAYMAMRSLVDALEVDDPIEYWKSAAYPLNFIEGYQLSRVLREHVSGRRCAPPILEAVRRAKLASLPFDRLRNYQELDVTNARQRSLQKALDADGALDVLWIPPSLPYYRPAGSFERVRPFTKRLVFSAWHMVPRSIAALLSYEVERRAFSADESAPRNDADARKSRRGLLRFSRTDGRLTGLPNLALMYPCLVLARLCDPRRAALELGSECTAEQVQTWAEAQVRKVLPPLVPMADEAEPIDEQWYWKAPLLLDLVNAREGEFARDWWTRDNLEDEWSGASAGSDEDGEDPATIWREHVAAAREVIASGDWPRGKAPHDLPAVLARIGLGAPGTVALRALDRLFPQGQADENIRIRTAAAQIGWAFRSFFNRPESMALVRRGRADPYWKLVLEYGQLGCLSSVVEEYLHVLRDSCGVTSASPTKAIAEVASTAMNALQVRTASLEVDELVLSEDGGSAELRKQHMRSLFAMRFGSDKDEDQKQVQRDTNVRDAFNSPFWPFVLATTSVGQEGLDFHWYCHCVVHWNLPSNPVDLEQREGRVHRFKGHALRKNIASAYGERAIRSPVSDVWVSAFSLAREKINGDRGLVPYWLFAVENGACIERQIPLYPLSRDEIRYRALRRSLGAYRIVFGQPRQDELLAYLMHTVDHDRLEELSRVLQVNLCPPTFETGQHPALPTGDQSA